MFNEIFLKEVNPPEFSTSEVILVQGLPGMGLVAKIASDYLIETLQGQLLARIHSSYLPPIVRLERGMGNLARLEFYEITSLTPNLLVLTGDSQPADIGIMSVMRTVLDYSINCGITAVAAFGGLRSQEEYDVAGFGYSHKTINWLSREIPVLDEGEISGAVGVLTAIAHVQHSLRSYGLLGKLIMGAVDPAASRNVLQVFSNLHGLDPPLTNFDWLETKIQEAQKAETPAQDFYKQSTVPFEQSEDKQPGYYI
ncbi:MAG: PAC2 family protein [Candidatus Heimdallarchaeota archaeon]